jgi:glutaryl-CoA dehydrogenase
MRETVGWAREVLGGNGVLLEHHVGRAVTGESAAAGRDGRGKHPADGQGR